MGFADGREVGRRVIAYSDQAKSEELGRKLERLVATVSNNERPAGELARWVEGLPVKMRAKLVAWGLIDLRTSAASMPLAVYGDRDALVPVQRSVDALQRVLKKGGHRGLDLKIIPFADHSFTDWTFNQRIEIEKPIVEWILARLAELPSGTPATSTPQQR